MVRKVTNVLVKGKFAFCKQETDSNKKWSEQNVR